LRENKANTGFLSFPSSSETSCQVITAIIQRVLPFKKLPSTHRPGEAVSGWEMEHSQLISFDGLRRGNPVGVTKVPLHPINQITVGNSSQVQHFVHGCSRRSQIEGEVVLSNACPLLPCLWAKRRAEQRAQENSVISTTVLPAVKLRHSLKECLHISSVIFV
jgi:hypothetical protein